MIRNLESVDYQLKICPIDVTDWIEASKHMIVSIFHKIKHNYLTFFFLTPEIPIYIYTKFERFISISFFLLNSQKSP